MFKYLHENKWNKDILRLSKTKKFVASKTSPSELQKGGLGDRREMKPKEAENVRNEERARVAVKVWTNVINYSSHLEFSKICLQVECNFQSIVWWHF